MTFKKKLLAVLLLLLVLSLLIFPQARTAAENLTLRDIAIADLVSLSSDADLNEAGKSIAETLFTKLAFSQKLSLVERSRLKDAIREIERGELGITEPSTAAKIGKAVGVRHIFIGTLSELKREGVILINTRLIEVESGRVISGWDERATANKLSQVPSDLADKILGQLFPGSPVLAALKSTLIPGWGQLSNGRSSGYLMIGGGLAAIGGVVATPLSLSRAKDARAELAKPVIDGDTLISVVEYNQVVLKAYDEAKRDVDTKRDRRNTAAIVLGAVWGLNILDAYIETSLLRKSRQQAVQRALAFEPIPDFQGIVMRVRF
ncbi:hypothetical protein HYR99_10335 [Candidatus Poribacteria bacterium]|nr:hypothetical protein [Candidatus Poribacteria bacterium]